MPRHPFADILESAMSVHVEQEPEFTFPFKEAQRERLIELAQHAAPDQRLQRAEFVRYIVGSGPFKKEARENMVLMFWRYLDFDNAADDLRLSHISGNEMGQLSNVDCLLVRYDGHSIVFDVSSSELLERTDGA